MSSGSNIRVVGPGSAAEGQTAAVEDTVDEPLTLEDEWVDEWDDEPAPARNHEWVVPAIAALLVVGWTAFYAWANLAELLSGGTPQQWSGWIVAWSVPVLLVVSLWILTQRNSRREAVRFGEVARLLSDESAALETRLSTVNRELSLAREFLGSQSRELDSLGRIASERISEHAGNLQGLIQDNGAQVDAIATVSTAALENMVRLRDDLPVIANSARDVSNQIGSAGRTAHGQIEELVAGFQRLNDFGSASEHQVTALQVRIDAALAGFEAQTAQIEQIAGSRFDALRATSEDFRADLDGREVEALAALRRRADTLAEELANARTELEGQEELAVIALRTRLGALRDESRVVGRSVREGEEGALELWGERLEAMQARVTSALDELAALDRKAAEDAQHKLQELTHEAARIDADMLERGEALHERFESRRAQVAQAEQEAGEALEARLAELDHAIASRRTEHLEKIATLTDHGEAIAARLDTLRDDLAQLAQQGSDTQAVLGEGAASLAANLDQGRSSVEATASAVRALTEDTVRLLELIQASAQHSRDELPAAIDEAGSKLSITEDRVNQLHVLLAEAGERGADLSAYVIGAKSEGRQALEQLEAFHERFGETNGGHLQEIERLQAALSGLGQTSENLSQTTKRELRESIGLLEQASRDAVGAIRTDAAANISEIAERIGSESSAAIERALRGRTVDAVAELEAAAARASDASRDATVQLRDQLGKVNELASNLEARVTRARERAEEQVDNDFSRRMALITESLNSNAIDISKAMSNDVTDTAWASYLRGDRGIFTRRAVRLLDHTEARDIAELYGADGEFAENVSRYIHDFEAMLRAMLSTRDGHALGVTLLSSDMGKLYVALAQAIERLRT